MSEVPVRSLRVLTLCPPGLGLVTVGQQLSPGFQAGQPGLESSLFHVRSMRLAAGPWGWAPQERSEAALQGGRTWGHSACDSMEPGTALFS